MRFFGDILFFIYKYIYINIVIDIKRIIIIVFFINDNILCNKAFFLFISKF